MNLRFLFEKQCLSKHPRLARKFEAWGYSLKQNDARIAALMNKYRGSRCFIVATGPSLQVSDLDMLVNEVTFGCNKIYLAFDRTDWRPTYYTVMDVIVAENIKPEIDRIESEKIFPDCVKPYLAELNNIMWVRSRQYEEARFSSNIFNGVVGGYTVIYAQIQMAYFMGFSEVYLIGLDFSFEKSSSTGVVSQHGEILESGGEINHFDPNYRSVGEHWTMPRLDLQYEHFKVAKRYFEQDGRVILNASRSSALDVFNRVSLDDIL